jgi:hypothetical protein
VSAPNINIGVDPHHRFDGGGGYVYIVRTDRRYYEIIFKDADGRRWRLNTWETSYRDALEAVRSFANMQGENWERHLREAKLLEG